jgi:TPR repeat protein
MDLVEAARYYKIAADQNHARGQYEYAVCLANGRGVPVDGIAAARYFKLAADHNLARG